MPQPDAYVRQHDFTDYSATYPAAPHNGQWLDEEFNAVKNTADEIIARLGLIQRDDGQIANLSIGLDQLKPEVVLGTPTDWATGQAYTLKAVVWESDILYVCNVAHTSGVFATDLGAGKWTAYLDYADPLGDAQDAVTAAEAAQEAAEDAQAAAETAQTGAEAAQAAAEAAQVAAEAAQTSITLPLPVDSGGTGATAAAQARTNLGGTATGVAVFTAADAAAARTAIGAVIGTDVQAFDAGLEYLNGLDFTNEATFKAGVNLEPGTDVQAQNAGLAYLAGLAFTNEATFKAGVNLELGVDVQAYDADTTKNDVANTFTGGLQTIAGTGSSKLRLQRDGQVAVFDVYHDTANTFLDASNSGAVLYLRSAASTRVAIAPTLITLTGNVVIDTGALKLTAYTVGTLPAASIAGAYSVVCVSDANGPTYNATVSGGGAVKIPVMSDGSNWKCR